MLLQNIEFDFKPTRGSDYKRYVHGYKTALAAIDVLDLKGDEDALTKMCEIMDDFFADLLGEDYADRLDIDTDDIEPLLHLLTELNSAAEFPSLGTVLPALPEAEDASVTSSLAVAPPNRAQRRAARRAAKRHA